MVALTDLLPASFRGAGFLVPKDTVKEGRNSIEFKYPGNLFRYVEDNGGTPPEFDITAYLTDQPRGSLAGKYNALRSALLTPGPGTLNHPWYGAQFCAVKGPHTVKRDDHDTGVLELQITFWVTGPPTFPALTTVIPAAITNRGQSLTAQIFNVFVTEFQLPASPFSQAFLDGVSRNVTGELTEAFPATAAVTSAAFAIELVAPAIGIASAGNLAGTTEPLATAQQSGLATNLTTLFQGAFADPANTNVSIVLNYKTIFANLVNFAAQVDAIPTTTQDLTDRQAAADLFVTSSMAAAFSGLCQGFAAKAASKDYRTAEDVQVDYQELTDDWAALAERSVLDADLRLQLLTLMTDTGMILANLEVTLPSIIAFGVPGMPMSVLSYYLYDSDGNELQLFDLNPDDPPMMIDGQADVLAVAGLPSAS